MRTFWSIFLSILGLMIFYVVLRQNPSNGWDPAGDPIELWIALGVGGLLGERVSERLKQRSKEQT